MFTSTICDDLLSQKLAYEAADSYAYSKKKLVSLASIQAAYGSDQSVQLDQLHTTN